MSKSTITRIAIALVVIAVLCVAALIIGYLAFGRQLLSSGQIFGKPQVPESQLFADKDIPPLPPATMDVAFTNPTGEVHLKTGEILPLHGKMLSQYPVHGMELWVDDTIWEARQPSTETETTAFSGLWNWKPEKSGVYRLTLRGIDKTGRSAYSSVLTAVVEGDVDQGTGNPVLPLFDNAKLTPAPEFTPSPGGGGAPAGSDPVPTNGETTTTDTPSGLEPPQVPEPPDRSTLPLPLIQGESINLEVTVARPSACEVQIDVQDLNNIATGLMITRFGPNDQDFFPIVAMKLEKNQLSTYLDRDSKFEGTYLYSVYAYNSTGGSRSEIHEAEISSACAGDTWNGVVFADMKIVPKTDVENMHCYFWLDQLQWDRIPVLEGQSLTPMSENDLRYWMTNLNSMLLDSGQETREDVATAYDLTPFAPDLSMTGLANFRLNIECQNVTSDTSVNMGTASGMVNLVDKDKLMVFSAPQFDFYMYLGSKLILGSQPSMNIGIASPVDVEQVLDEQKCPDALKLWCTWNLDDRILLRWHWNPQPCFYNFYPEPDQQYVCVNKPDNFSVYQYTHNPQYSFITAEYAPSPQADGYYYESFIKPSGDWVIDPNDSYSEQQKKKALATQEFCIRAQSMSSGSHFLQSQDFQESCIRLGDAANANPVVEKTAVLEPIESGVYQYKIVGQGEYVGESGPEYVINPDSLQSVWQVFGTEAVYYDPTLWKDYGFFKFDISNLVGKKITKATLKIPTSNMDFYAISDGFFVADENKICKTALLLLNRNGSVGYHANPPNATTVISNSDGSNNVTDEVQNWVNGSTPNFGFMVEVYNMMNFTGTRLHGCKYTFDDVQLEIEYEE